MIGELYPGEFEAMEHNGRMDALEQEPCDVFDEYGNYKYPGDVELTEPNTATSMPCKDAISRQAVLDAITANCIWENEYNLTSSRIKKAVESLPLVNPQPKTGHWITKPHIYGVAFCSECDFELRIDDTKYCPNCGAKMIKPQEREGTDADNQT